MENIVVGGQTLCIDENDGLWKALMEKYGEKPKTGWKEPKSGSTVWVVHPWWGAGVAEMHYMPAEDERDALAYERAAAFQDEAFAKMQTRAEILRRKLIRFGAKHEKPNGSAYRWAIVWDMDAQRFATVTYKSYYNLFMPMFYTEECAWAALEEFRDELMWLVAEYEQRLDAK